MSLLRKKRKIRKMINEDNLESDDDNDNDDDDDDDSDDNDLFPPPLPSPPPISPSKKKLSSEFKNLLNQLKKPVCGLTYEEHDASDDVVVFVDGNLIQNIEVDQNKCVDESAIDSDVVSLFTRDDASTHNEIEKDGMTQNESKTPELYIAHSLDGAMEIIKKHEIEHTLRFSTYFTQGNFGKTDVTCKKHKVYWSSDGIEFSGTPFMLLGIKAMDCHHGRDRNINLKKKYKEQNELQNLSGTKNDHVYKKKHKRVQNCKKFGCPAKVVVTEVVSFPEYKLVQDTLRKRKQRAAELRNDVSAKKELKQIRTFRVSIPLLDSHQGHVISKDAGTSQRIDPEIAEKISQYVKEGVNSTNEMEHLIEMFVQDLFTDKEIPPRSNKRFHPSKSTIRNHIIQTRRKLCKSLIDQERLQEKIKEWKEMDPSTKIFFRPKGKLVSEEDNEDENEMEFDEVKLIGDKETSLLFVYQSGLQKKLLEKYGDEMILLDATYRTIHYELPLFFLVVETNTDYQVAGLFVSENETEESITEALLILKSWNENLKPKIAMADYSAEEIKSLEKVFEGCKVFLSDFHREQAWDKWLKSNGFTADRMKLLKYLRSVARAYTLDDCKTALEALQKSSFWTESETLRDYLNNYWLNIMPRWVAAYRQDHLLANIDTNNTVERQNKTLKYSNLYRHRNSSLTRMLTILIEDFQFELRSGKKKVRKRKIVNGESIRASLNEIREMSYLVEDDDDLVDTVYTELSELIKVMKENLPRE